MIKQRKSLALALGLALAMPVLAADTDRGQASPPKATSAKSESAAAKESGAAVRMSKLIGMNVRGAGGESLGEVKDVVLDANTGRIHYVVLSFGGFLGLGDKLFAVPLAKMHSDADGKLVLDVPKEQLASAPGFDLKQWPDWMSDPYRAEVDRRYGVPDAGANARFRRASDLLKAEVRDANRADIGNVEDMVVDLGNGRVHYVVVQFDRAWNPNDKLVALPMNALSSVAAAPPPERSADSASPPRNAPGFLSFESPSGPTQGIASATNPPGGVPTRPAPIDPTQVRPLPREPVGPSSYADDEDLLYKGTREQLRSAPEFDKDRYPDLSDAATRQEFDRRLSNMR